MQDYDWQVMNSKRPSRNAGTAAGATASISRPSPSRGLGPVGGDHLAQELVMLVTDMMLQRFFTTMLM
ncbi:hypothetical protein EYF80_040910 [Liparis tanakae]|uniref:Uncharacterized protein n=1 Tax=Liparis tanakae TaxID=230148 RepID=A0A4Z2G5M8_9TELE|nr:hypothetical protein EYF80_040910 [Liparis tanakae]